MKKTSYSKNKKKKSTTTTTTTTRKASILRAGFTGDAEARIGNVEENTVVLLLHIGNDIEYRVDVVGCGGHGEAGGGSGGAVDEEVVGWESDIHSGEHESYGGRDNGECVASVKATKGCDCCIFAYSSPEFVSHRRVCRRHQPCECCP